MKLTTVRRSDGEHTGRAVIHPAQTAVSAAGLRKVVEALNYLRAYEVQRGANDRARDWNRTQLHQRGYETHLQGKYENVIALPTSQVIHPRR